MISSKSPSKLSASFSPSMRAIQTAKLMRENADLRMRGNELSNLELVGQSSAIKHVKLAIERLSNATSRVLIQGGAGSGKELVARKIRIILNGQATNL